METQLNNNEVEIFFIDPCFEEEKLIPYEYEPEQQEQAQSNNFDLSMLCERIANDCSEEKLISKYGINISKIMPAFNELRIYINDEPIEDASSSINLSLIEEKPIKIKIGFNFQTIYYVVVNNININTCNTTAGNVELCDLVCKTDENKTSISSFLTEEMISDIERKAKTEEKLTSTPIAAYYRQGEGEIVQSWEDFLEEEVYQVYSSKRRPVILASNEFEDHYKQLLGAVNYTYLLQQLSSKESDKMDLEYLLGSDEDGAVVEQKGGCAIDSSAMKKIQDQILKEYGVEIIKSAISSLTQTLEYFEILEDEFDIQEIIIAFLRKAIKVLGLKWPEANNFKVKGQKELEYTSKKAFQQELYNGDTSESERYYEPEKEISQIGSPAKKQPGMIKFSKRITKYIKSARKMRSKEFKAHNYEIDEREKVLKKQDIEVYHFIQAHQIIIVTEVKRPGELDFKSKLNDLASATREHLQELIVAGVTYNRKHIYGIVTNLENWVFYEFRESTKYKNKLLDYAPYEYNLLAEFENELLSMKTGLKNTLNESIYEYSYSKNIQSLFTFLMRFLHAGFNNESMIEIYGPHTIEEESVTDDERQKEKIRENKKEQQKEEKPNKEKTEQMTEQQAATEDNGLKDNN